MSKNSRDISMNLRAYSSRVPDPWCTLPWHPALFPRSRMRACHGVNSPSHEWRAFSRVNGGFIPADPRRISVSPAKLLEFRCNLISPTGSRHFAHFLRV